MGFTLPELIISVSIFAVVVSIVAGMYLSAFRETRRSNAQNQIFEDARFIMARIAEEIRSGMIDYDEYYNQNVVIPSLQAGVDVPDADTANSQNYGQNYGRYYSSFFYPGDDKALGFDCNSVTQNEVGNGQVQRRGDRRNKRDCVPLRRTIDRNTGSNPYPGKYLGAQESRESALCGNIAYSLNASASSPNRGICMGGSNGDPDALRELHNSELYLISEDGYKKTILAREVIGGIQRLTAVENPVYALSILKMNGGDSNNDGVPDSFSCAPEFRCLYPPLPGIGTLPRPPRGITGNRLVPDLDFVDEVDDSSQGLFSRDFVPISPLRVNVSQLEFIISPDENPYYAFGESSVQKQPGVTVILTVGPNPAFGRTQENFQPVTMIETVSPRVLKRIPAPLLVQPKP